MAARFTTITDVEPLTTRLAKTALVVLAAWDALCAVATQGLPYTRYPALWSCIFLIACGSAIIAVTSWRPRAMQLCGAITVTAFAMRAGMIVLAYQGGLLVGDHGAQVTQLWQGTANWCFHAFTWAVIFTRGLVPLVARTDRHRR